MVLLGLGWPVFAQVERDQQLTLDVQRSEFSEEFELLLAGERELALVVNESQTPITRGVAIIIGESGQGPFSHHSIAPLASSLNRLGWVTMTMAAPTSGFFAPPAEEDQPTTADNPPPHVKQAHAHLTQASFDQHEQELIVQLQAVVSRSREYPGFFLVIAQGTSAAWLTKIYSEGKADLPDALITIGPFWPQRNFNRLLPDLLAKTQMPLLDIYSQWDNEWSRQTVAQRKVEAEKQLKLHYRQRELIGPALDREQYQLLAKEIYGWLTHMGW